MRPVFAAFGLSLVGLAAYLTLAPIPVAPESWQAQPNPGRQGIFAVNDRLANIKPLSLGQDHGPEYITQHDGWIYAGLASGAVVRARADSPAGAGVEVLFNTGGRPLGLDFDGQGRMLIADGMLGLMRAAADSNGNWSVEPLVTQVDEPVANDPIRYADAVLFAPDGTIYFTDASRRFAPKDWGSTFNASVLDTLEHSCSGRLLAYDPGLKHTHVVMQDLCFPNGLALTEDGRQLLLSETGTYRIWRLDPTRQGNGPLSAKQALAQPSPMARVIIDNLPGFPDNLTRGQDGRVWCGLTKPRSPVIDWAASRPWARAITLRLPQVLWPVPKPYGEVFAFDDEGRVLIDLQDPKGSYPETTAATEVGGRLYIQSLNADTLGWVEKKDLGF